MADNFAYRSGPKELRQIPIASGTVVAVGENVKLSSGKAVLMAATADNLDFQGVSAEAHGALDPSGSIGVYIPNPLTVFEFNLDAATAITFGDALQYGGGAQTLKKSTTDPIFTAVESKLAATSILCVARMTHKTGNTDLIGDAS